MSKNNSKSKLQANEDSNNINNNILNNNININKNNNNIIKKDSKFKKGNNIGKDTRFSKDNILASKYKDEYCDMLIDFFSNIEKEIIYKEIYFPDGSIKSKEPVQVLPPRLPTYEGFASKIGVTMDTLLNWCDKHPRFRDCYARAKEIQKDILLTNGVQKQYDSNLTKFLLTNNHGMAEQVKNDVTYKFVTNDEIDEESD